MSRRLPSQIIAFTGVGLLAAVVHYGLLVGLVELAGWRAIPATLTGYIGGGIVSYGLNRRHTYRSDRPHEEAGWRFAVVAAVGFGLTYLSMSLLHGQLGIQYVVAQVLTTGIVLVWSFIAHKLWTFRGST
jgi:putative flippase GtrA